jgi:hypothetical protein
MATDKGKEPVTEELIQTPYLKPEALSEQIKEQWETFAEKLDHFHTFMVEEVSKHVSPDYMKTYDDNMGKLYIMGKKQAESRGAKIHPLAPRIGFAVFMYRKQIFDAVEKIKDESIPLDDLKLPQGLIDKPEQMVAECPRPVLYKIFRYMLCFISLMDKIRGLEAVQTGLQNARIG